ncbi:MAG: WD40 repeat domain-containing protein, partial [Prochlorothrix sp.]
MAFNAPGDRLATASADQTVRLWNLKGETVAVLTGHQSRVWQVRFNAQGDRLATVSDV